MVSLLFLDFSRVLLWFLWFLVVCLEVFFEVFLTYFYYQPYAVSMGTMGGSSEAPLIHHHYFEALLIAIELNGVSRGYAQAYAHNPGLHKLHKGYRFSFGGFFFHSTQ